MDEKVGGRAATGLRPFAPIVTALERFNETMAEGGDTDLSPALLAALVTLGYLRKEGLASYAVTALGRDANLAARAAQAVPKDAPDIERYSANGAEWFDSPNDASFVEGLKVGDTFTVEVSRWSIRRTYVVTKAPDVTSDDYVVEPILAAAPTSQEDSGNR